MEDKNLNIKTSSDGRILSCKIENDNPNNRFAFYVNLNGKRIHTQWYSKNSLLTFDCSSKAGYYRVTAFKKDASDQITFKNSPPVFISLGITPPEQFGIENEASAYLIRGRNWDIEALHYPGESKRLFIMLPSAINRQKITPPAFNRWNWAQNGHFPGHVICFADPTLKIDERMLLGWCLGTIERPAHDDLIGAITSFARNKSIPNEKIFIYGSSAGGFSSLSISPKIPGSTAISINGQTRILNYEIQRQVDLVMENCFSGLNKEEILIRYASEVDASIPWAEERNSRAIIVQNTKDKHHYEEHYSHFIQSTLGKVSTSGINIDRNITTVLYEDDRGHVAESEEMSRYIIDLLDRGS